jgi:hypothetical protein
MSVMQTLQLKKVSNVKVNNYGFALSSLKPKEKKRSMGATDVSCDIVLVVRAIRSFCIVVVNL